MIVTTYFEIGNGWFFDWGFALFMITYFVAAMELNKYEHPSALSLKKSLNEIKSGNQEIFEYLKQNL
jgi:hypothetical protein